jgi:hypothetical protein
MEIEREETENTVPSISSSTCAHTHFRLYTMAVLSFPKFDILRESHKQQECILTLSFSIGLLIRTKFKSFRTLLVPHTTPAAIRPDFQVQKGVIARCKMGAAPVSIYTIFFYRPSISSSSTALGSKHSSPPHFSTFNSPYPRLPSSDLSLVPPADTRS